MIQTPEDAHERLDELMERVKQVQNGQSQPLDERGLPWWFGPDYKPTPEALKGFEEDTMDQDRASSPTIQTSKTNPES